MSLKKWSIYLFSILLGILLLWITYKLSEDYDEQAYIQQHSPQVKMPVVKRLKGWGTVRYPNKVYVSYLGKKYILESSNQYFRKTAKLDSILVHYDPTRDRAIQADGKVTKPYVLLLLLGLVSLAVVIGTVVDLRRQLTKTIVA